MDMYDIVHLVHFNTLSMCLQTDQNHANMNVDNPKFNECALAYQLFIIVVGEGVANVMRSVTPIISTVHNLSLQSYILKAYV